MDYWYDQQIARYLTQLIRVFSHFKVEENTSQGPRLNRVPCRYADASRLVSQLIRGNSENVVNSAPMITVGIQSLKLSRARSQDPFLADTRQVAERKWDPNNARYSSEQGNLYTVSRYMPVPYDLTIQVDIWTTNTNTKLSLLEQIMVLFNPSIQLQSNDNPLDWSNVFEVELTDVNWSNRSLPAGTEDALDIATLTFEVPIWVSPPAKVTRQKIIQTIIADVHSVKSIAELNYNGYYYDFFKNIPEDARIVVTPNNYRVKIEPGSATLLNMDGSNAVWKDIIEMQGQLSNTSRLELNLTDDIADYSQLVIGLVTASTDPSQLVFQLDVDTLPPNTLPPVDRVIDPNTKWPVNGLPAASLGQRYLLNHPLVNLPNSWNLVAQTGDIIEYNGSAWVVSFSSATSGAATVFNMFSGNQYRWTGTEWISTWQGTYTEGYWRLIL